MRNRIPWIIACSLLLYRWLLILAPDEFSDEYADPALQVFRQYCWDTYHEQGTRGVLRLWLPTFTDALYGILAEQSTMLKQILCPGLACRVGPELCPLSLLLAKQSMDALWTPLSSHFRHTTGLYSRSHCPFLLGWSDYAPLHAYPTEALATLYPLPHARCACRRNDSDTLQRALWLAQRCTQSAPGSVRHFAGLSAVAYMAGPAFFQQEHEHHSLIKEEATSNDCKCSFPYFAIVTSGTLKTLQVAL